MAHLDDVVTRDLIGETSNMDRDGTGIELEFKQTYEVTPLITDFKWKVKSTIYVKMRKDESTQYDGLVRKDISMNVGNERIYLSTGTNRQGDLSTYHFEINKNTGVRVNNNLISTDVWSFTPILEHEFIINLTNTGRNGIRLYVGAFFNNSTEYYFADYSIIYLTLPPYSGTFYKMNNRYYRVMPYIKLNNIWKPARQYVKVDGCWKLSQDDWMWRP